MPPLPKEPLLQVTWETHSTLDNARNSFRHVLIALSLSVMPSPQLHRHFYGADSSATRMHDTHSAKSGLLVGSRPQCISIIACATCVEEWIGGRRGRDSGPVIHGTTTSHMQRYVCSFCTARSRKCRVGASVLRIASANRAAALEGPKSIRKDDATDDAN
jgi:hypothetical protein